METLQTDRRAEPGKANANSGTVKSLGIVRQALLIQAGLGSIGAVEFLKAHGIGGAVITRVLTSEAVREDDRTA